MLEVIALVHTMLIVAYMRSLPLRWQYNLVEYPYKFPLQVHHGGRHFSRPVGGMANLSLLQEITKL